MDRSDITVLIVDDIPQNLQIAANIIHKEGYNIILAKSGEEALEAVKNNELHLILLDIMMPGMDGFEVCRRLKADPKSRDIPVIFVTAKTEIDSLEEGFDLGAVDYVNKPLMDRIILARVKTQIEQYLLKKEVSSEHELMQSVLKDSPFIFCRMDPKLNIIYANEDFKRALLGYCNDPVGLSITDVLPKNIQSLPTLALHKLTYEKQIHSTTVKLPFQDGSLHYISWICRAVFDDSKQVIAYQCFGEDVTEQQNMIQEINDRNLILEKSQDMGHLLNWYYTPEDMKIHFGNMRNNPIPVAGMIFDLKEGIKAVHPDDIDILGKSINDFIKGEKELSTVFRIHIEGQLYHFKCIGYTETQNNTTQFKGILQDISELMHIKQKNVNLQEEQSSIFDALGEGIIQFTPDHTIIQANTAAALLSGHENSSQLIGLKCYEAFYSRDKLCDICTSENALRFGRRVQVEKPIDDNKIWNVSTTPIYKETGEIGSFIEVISDVSEIYEQRHKLLLSEGRLSTALEAAQIGTYTGNFETESWFPDKQLIRLLGMEKKDVFSFIDMFELIHPEDLPLVQHNLEKYRKGENQRFHAEFRIIGPNNHYKYFRCSGQTLDVTAAQTPKNWMGVFVDITEEKKMLETIRHQEETLAQSRKLKAMGQLAGGVAHDFNNMLSTILGFAELMEEDLEGQDEMLHYTKTIIDTCEKASSLTQKLLSFSRKKSTHSSAVDIHEMLINSIDLMKRSMGKDIEIHKQFNAGNKYIMGDFSQLQNVILNMGFNARDAMPDGGIFKITTDNIVMDEKACLNSSFDIHSGTFIRVRMEDNGSGMSKEVVEKIFEPFFTTKDVGKGTGLGLASSYGTINAHQGCISVNSEIGRGTIFDIYMPVSEEKTNTGKETAVKKTVKKGSGTILVVDDEEQIREMLRKLLMNLGYDVILAGDGYQGIERYKENQDKIACVILDVMMPKLDGAKTFEYLKEINPDIITIISSGFASNDQIESLKSRGISAFLKKPYRQADLGNLLMELLNEN